MRAAIFVCLVLFQVRANALFDVYLEVTPASTAILGSSVDPIYAGWVEVSGFESGFDPLSPHLVLASIGNIVTWEFVGYNMLIFYSALRTVPVSLYESAETYYAFCTGAPEAATVTWPSPATPAAFDRSSVPE